MMACGTYWGMMNTDTERNLCILRDDDYAMCHVLIVKYLLNIAHGFDIFTYN